MFRKVDNFTMTLFAFVYAFGQTRNPETEIFYNDCPTSEADFANRQLLYAALRERQVSKNSSEIRYDKRSKKSTYLQIFGDDFDKIYSGFQTYHIHSNH